MKKIEFWPNAPLRRSGLIWFLASFIFTSHLADANDSPTQPTQPAAVENANRLSPASFYETPALKSKVTFEVKRQSLTTLLEELQKQTGIVFSQDAQRPAENLLVTARVKDMPLGELMHNLSRLFGVTWRKSGGGFAVRGSEETPVEAQLRSVGDMARVGFKASFKNADEEMALAALIFPRTKAAALQSPAGFAVADLPEELRLKLRQQIRQRIALSVIRTHQQASPAYLEDCVLHIRPVEAGTTINEGQTSYISKWEAVVATPLGEEVVVLPFQLPAMTNETVNLPVADK